MTEKMAKVRNSSLEKADVEGAKKKQDMLTKARNKFFHFGEHKPHKTADGDHQKKLNVTEHKVNKNVDSDNQKKSKTQSTLDYFFKSSAHRDKENVLENFSQNGRLHKQTSLGAEGIKIEIEEYDDFPPISRDRPATICTDKFSENRDTAALALERPRKKLSFREPENDYNRMTNGAISRKGETNCLELPKGMRRSVSFTNGILHRTPSVSDFDLESQAMRVVRTVGQAFEVCHKLSITAPENDNLDQDEQDTLTQDLLSDRLSDFTTDKNKRDIMCEGDCDKISLPPDEPNFKDLQQDNIQKTTRLPHFDLLPPPPITNTKKSPLISAETYSSPHSDVLTSGNDSGNCNLPPAGSALSAHHEIQLLREQLEQQNQQTQAAMAQLQLTREQLTSEQSARMEAQTRTHQLLVHNRELLDHIAALVSHLQGGENAGTQHTPAHVTLPQQQHYAPVADNYMADYSDIATLDNNATLQTLASNPQGLIENRAVASCLPQSPLRPAFSSTGSYFNFPYPPEVSYEAQLLQRLQALNSCTPPTPFPYNFPQAYPPFFYSPYYSQPLLTNSCTLPNPSSKTYSQSPLPTRHSFHDSPIAERRFNAGRSSEPRQVSHLSRENLNFPQQLLSQSFHNPTMQPQHNPSLQNQSQVNVKQTQNKSGSLQHNLNQNVHNQQNSSTSSQKKNPQTNSPQRQSVPNATDPSIDTQFIRPLPQMGTLTTTDVDGRVTVIVPVPANNNDNNVNNISTEGLLANLRLTDDFRFTGGLITRTTSEKVPNRSELMSQVQRTMWARHTTK